MEIREKAADAAERLTATMMRRYDAADLPPRGTFLYHQGVFLSGVLENYRITKNEAYFAYVKAWVDSIVREDGTIPLYDENNSEIIQPGLDRGSIDHIQPGVLLFPLYERTGDVRYRTAIESLMDILKGWKRNRAGGFWHKEVHPDQMWLDSLYMGGPIRALYAGFSGRTEYLEDAVEQAFIMHEHMTDSKSGLMFHAWDESRREAWADRETGLSPEIWGRAQGWYVVAVLELLRRMPEDHPKREGLVRIERSLLEALLKYRDRESKLWYQVVNKGECESNWIETSCSCLFTAAIAGAIRMGILEERYKPCVNECFEALYNGADQRDGDFVIKNICVGTGVCDYAGYIARPTTENDLHGVGAFLLMCAAVAGMN